MKTIQEKRWLILGTLLILFGSLGLLEAYTDLTTWAWVAVLALTGLGTFGIYLTNRSNWGLLIPPYGLGAIALFVTLTEMSLLPNEFVVLFVFSAIAIPFLVGYFRNREQWGLLIPAYVLGVIAAFVTLIQTGFLANNFRATFVLTAIALPFLIGFFGHRKLWGLLIPAYVLLTTGIMIGLIERELLNGLSIPVYVMFAIAAPFFVVYVVNPQRWWALIPAGTMTVIGFSIILTETLIAYLIPVILILTGVLIIVRQFTDREPPPEQPKMAD